MNWLTKERIKIYSRIFLVFYVIIYGYWIFSGTGIVDGQGKPIGSDFLGYWAASKIILSGNPSDVYDQAILFSIEEGISGVRFLLPVNYPPTYYLIIAPLALLPYLPSLGIWLVSTLLLYLFVIHRIAPHPATIWLTLAFPGTFQNFIHGQNGFLSAAILGGGLLCMQRFPFMGGVILAFLTYKPHLAVLIPVVLIAGRYWKTLAGMVTCTVLLMSLSSLVFGMNTWIHFTQNISFAFKILQTSALPLFQMPTTFAAALLVGMHPLVAKILHGVVAFAALIITVWIWYKQSPFFLRASALVLGILLFTPHANTHDLTLLALPLALIGWQIRLQDQPSRGMIILPICWVIPLVCVPIAYLTKIQLTPLIQIVFFLVVLQMTKRYSVPKMG
jgi:hypothetical protein